MPQKELGLKPIQTFYCAYLLRSTVSRASLYIGSTLNPRRRLAQHNGTTPGGARRTSRHKLRPWQMTLLVSGFPSSLAALQFEWAWQHPHFSSKIPAALRPAGVKRRTKRRTKKYASTGIVARLQALHLLLRVSAFARWPLAVRFFERDVWELWGLWCARESVPLRGEVSVVLDERRAEGEGPLKRQWDASGVGGLRGLDIGAEKVEAHVQKARGILEAGPVVCGVCAGVVRAEVAVVCPHSGCAHVAHLGCLAGVFLKAEDDTQVLPVRGECPGCGGGTAWVDLVKELSVRIRGKVKPTKTKKGAAAGDQEKDEDEDEEEDLMDAEMAQLEGGETDMSDDDEPVIKKKPAKKAAKKKAAKPKPRRKGRLPSVIEDSDDDPASNPLSSSDSDTETPPPPRTARGRKTACASDATEKKKKRAVTKKALDPVAEESTEAEAVESKPVKKARGRSKKAIETPEPDAEESTGAEVVESKPVKKARGRSKKAIETPEPDAEESTEAEAVRSKPVKKARGRSKKAIETPEPDAEEKPKRARSRPRKVVTEESAGGSDGEKPKKAKGRPRKTLAAADSSGEIDDGGPAKPKRRRKTRDTVGDGEWDGVETIV